jgi:RimJ/RimL family protein N-acetyltransferase
MQDQLINDWKRIQDWISSRSGLHKVEHFLGIAREVDGEIVAAFGFDWHQDSSCMMHAAALAGGITRHLLHKAFAAPFEQWGYECVMAVIQSSNMKSRALAKRLGFAEFATVPGAHPSGALHFFVMYKKDCRWLKPLGEKEK